MKSITLFGLEKCSTCAKARTWLDEHEIAHEFIDYRDHPVPPETLALWAEALGGWEKLVNRASMTWRRLPDSRKAPASAHEWQALIAEFPALVRRPVMVDAKGAVSVGFSDKKYSQRLAV